jgi:hypothetical protein
MTRLIIKDDVKEEEERKITRHRNAELQKAMM